MRSEAKSPYIGKTTIYLVRHGDVHNPDGVFYERIPGFRLSELGRQQAHALGKFLASKSIDVLYASPLERAQETATIISSFHSQLPIISDERLIEVSSMKRGQKQADLALERWNFYKPQYTKLGGERMSEIWTRMQNFLHDIVRKNQGKRIVAVSHGDPIMLSMVKHLGKRLSLSSIRGEEYIDTAKGFELIFEGLSPLGLNKIDF